MAPQCLLTREQRLEQYAGHRTSVQLNFKKVTLSNPESRISVLHSQGTIQFKPTVPDNQTESGVPRINYGVTGTGTGVTGVYESGNLETKLES